jgi:hypothetical protein
MVFCMSVSSENVSGVEELGNHGRGWMIVCAPLVPSISTLQK